MPKAPGTVPNSADYVWEKMHVAIGCMCGKESLERRLADAAWSAFTAINGNDLEGELGEDLRFVLTWTKDNLDGDRVKRVPDDLELSRLIEKMLHVLLELTRLSAVEDFKAGLTT
jgi:hypothetical protein